MWKLVKTELSYIRTVWRLSQLSYLIFLLIYVLIAFRVVFDVHFHPASAIEIVNIFCHTMFRIMWGILPTVFLIFQLQLIFRETQEKHNRNFMLLPIKLAQIGIAKVLPTVLVILTFIFVLVLSGALYMRLMPERVLEVYEITTDANVWIDIFSILLWSIAVYTFFFRSFTQKPSNILGFLFIVILIIPELEYYIYLDIPFELYWQLYLSREFIHTLNGVLITSLVFMVAIYISFIRRRSFLR